MKISGFYLVVLVFILLGCKVDDNIDNTPELPQSASYDLNGDFKNDIEIVYNWFEWDGFTNSGEGIQGMLVPLNKNLILTYQVEGTLVYNRLFNNVNDTIRYNIDESYLWQRFGYFRLISIRSNSSIEDSVWPREWTIESDLFRDSYYLGIIINSDNDPIIGWVQLDINKRTGSIKILEKKFTSDDFILIGK